MASAKTLARKSRRSKAKAKAALQNTTSTPTSSQGVEKKPLGFLDLPYDIRFIIYKMCFARPIGIVPTVNRYRRRLGRKDKPREGDGQVWRKYSVYRYQWEGNLHRLPHWSERGLPTRDGTVVAVSLSRYLRQTPEQEALLHTVGQGVAPPITGTSAEEYDATNHFIYIDINGQAFVESTQHFYISGFTGVRLLKTCKQIRSEGAAVLYGHNNFIFNTHKVYTGRFFQYEADQIPGCRLSGGTYPSEEQISEATDKLFDRKFHSCNFVWHDPFLRFLIAIGPHNAALLKSVDITGSFEVQGLGWGPVSFVRILQIYTLVMARVCHSLTKITLHRMPGDPTWSYDSQEDEDEGNTGEEDGEETVKDNCRAKTNDERISKAVEKMVKGIPQLKELQLGSVENGNGHGANLPRSLGLP